MLASFSTVAVPRPAAALDFELPPGAIAHEIHITAIVKPARYVVVDAQDNILEITSNTDEDVVPLVYRGSIAKGNERPYTARIAAAYDRLVPAGSGRAGVLYREPEPLALLLKSANPASPILSAADQARLAGLLRSDDRRYAYSDSLN